MRTPYIPNQHGAWAMLVLPFCLAVAAAGFRPSHLLLFACWLLAYLLSYPALQWIRTGQGGRYRRPVFVYGCLLAPLAAALLYRWPSLLWFGVAALPLFLVNVGYARANRERAFANDLAAIVLFSAVVFPVFAVGSGSGGWDGWAVGAWKEASSLFAVSVAYFVGTVFYVKTVIREKRNAAFYRASVAYHAGSGLAVALAVDVRLALPFAVLLLRAALLPRRGLSVQRTGQLEIAFAAMMFAAIFFLS